MDDNQGDGRLKELESFDFSSSIAGNQLKFEKIFQKSLQIKKKCLPLQSQSKDRVVLKNRMVP